MDGGPAAGAVARRQARRAPAGAPLATPLATVQHAAAKALQQSCGGMKYLRWRPPGDRPRAGRRPRPAGILFGTTRCGSAQFRQQVLGPWTPQAPPPPAPANRWRDDLPGRRREDQALCTRSARSSSSVAGTWCRRRRCRRAARTPDLPRDRRRDHPQQRPAVVVLYGRESHLWIEAQYARTVRLLGQAEPGNWG